MSNRANLLILEDEPFIMLDLEFAAQDLGCKVQAAGPSLDGPTLRCLMRREPIRFC